MSCFHEHRNGIAVVRLELGLDQRTSLLFRKTGSPLTLVVASGCNPQASVGFVTVIQGRQAGNGVVGYQLAVDVVLMPEDTFRVPAKLEG